MKNSYEGIGQWAATFACSDIAEGQVVKISGKKEILSIDISPEIVDPDDIETLSDILVAGVNEAIKRVEETNSAEMEKITGSMNMPGLF